jgi:uncharacterized membrane protein
MTTNAKPRVDRRETARRLLQGEVEKLPAEEREIVERFIANRRVSRNIVQEYERSAGLGERVADKVAEVGGSWAFIITFLLCLVVWMAINSFVLAKGAFDPYPYILLNLCLSCVAAIQAPIIMMSQNRQAAKDRLEARLDYETNLRAEAQIEGLHEKIELLQAQIAFLVDARRIDS